MQTYLPACMIVTTHGVRGEMKALPLCDGAAFLAKFKRLYATPQGGGETPLLGVRAQGNMLLIRLGGVEDMDAARAQVGAPGTLPRRMPACPKAGILSTTCWAAVCWMPTPGRSTVPSGRWNTRPPRMYTPWWTRRAGNICSLRCRNSWTGWTWKHGRSMCGRSRASLPRR